ncbi:MAG: recombinase family protein [bacterium]
MYKDKFIAGYIRVSTEMQIERDSVIQQEDAIKAYAKAKGMPYKIYKDLGISGKNTERPGFQNLIRDVKSNQVSSVIVTRLDRITRSLLDLINLEKIFEQYDTSFVSLTQNLDTSTPMGRFSFYILGSVAQLEREVDAERVAENMTARAIRKKWNGGVIPWGFKYVPKEKTIAIEPKEAEVVKKIYELYSEHKSFRKVLQLLNSTGYRTRNGSYWAGTSIHRILSNPIYVGALTYNKRKTKGNTSVSRPKEEHTIVENVFEPIIEKEKYQEIQAMIDKNKPIASRTKGSRHLLSGLVKCELCGTKMFGWSGYTKRGNRFYSYYKCNGAISKGKSFCAGNNIDMKTLENMVESELKEFSLKPEKLTEKLAQYKNEFEASVEPLLKERKTLESEMSKLEQRIEKTFGLYEESIITKQEFVERKSKIDSEKAFCKTQLESLDDKFSSHDLTSFSPDNVLKQVRNFADVYKELNFDEKREFLKCLFPEIRVGKKEITYSLRLYPGLFNYDADWKSLNRRNVKDSGAVTIEYKTLRDPIGQIEISGEQIKQFRKEKGLTQKQFGEIMGVDKISVFCWEKGKYSPLKKHKGKLMQIFNQALFKGNNKRAK